MKALDKLKNGSSSGKRAIMVAKPARATFEDIPRPPAPIIPRDAKGRITKGYTLNPNGRLRGVPELIRSLTDDCRELIEHALLTMRGEISYLETRFTKEGEPYEIEVFPTHADRASARRELLERAIGKAPQLVGIVPAEAILERFEGVSDTDVARFIEMESRLSLPASAATVDSTAVPVEPGGDPPEPT